jgi:chloramphenicol O-acetyltransferase type A
VRFSPLSKEKDLVFYLHKTLAAVNHIECFKYRIEDNVYIYDQINASATIGRTDETLVFP